MKIKHTDEIPKLKNEQKFSVLVDHLGTPTSMCNEAGESVWEHSLDSCGRLKYGDHSSCPFLFQGQYYDKEIELAYNRFRYYDPEDGRYISKDPVGFLSEEYGFYNYVPDSNLQIDAFGLAYNKHKKNGQFAKKPGRKKKKNTKHGNSRDYDGTTYLYKRYDADGNFLKHGIANDPKKRYSDVELDGGRLDIEDSGTRSNMLDKERHLVETDPGPLNNEPWAGSNL